MIIIRQSDMCNVKVNSGSYKYKNVDTINDVKLVTQHFATRDTSIHDTQIYRFSSKT
jgi:hypothetical protein